MDVVFQGRLSRDQDIREVLNDVLALRTGELGFLRITSSAEKISGRLVLHQRRQIIGAQSPDTNESGYQAVRRLLSVQQGDFAYIDAEGVVLKPEEQNVSLDLRTVLELLPDLPEQLPERTEAPKTRTSREFARVAEAAQLVRDATAQTPAFEPASDQIVKLRELQKRGVFWRRFAIWAIVVIIVFAAARTYSPQIQSFIKSQKVLRELDQKGLQAVQDLSKRLKQFAGSR
jgi:hypothetical protein